MRSIGPEADRFFVEQQAMRHAELIDLATIDISAVDLPTKNERLLRDAKFAGLALRLRASGARSWMLIVGPLGLPVPHRPHPNASSRFGTGVRDQTRSLPERCSSGIFQTFVLPRLLPGNASLLRELSLISFRWA
jgi:hypothetical protein